ncbi:Rho termination factor N-terminal domain-containing protein [Plasmodiophora brassicae]|uniref:Uncharacterized protein n=1 Tax=Plasmodiophora brassicae TaxID=37360 RepID=A0A3P3Y9A9_PLABS|nr:unnamed protein product [Plasmodiophora brassicae]
MGETRDQLEALSRRDLQALAKARGVRANMKSADIIEEILAGASRTADEADAEPAAPAIEAQQAMVASEEGVCERPVEQATVDAAPGSAPAAAVDTLASESAEEEPSPRESVEAGDAGDGREGGEQEEAAVLADEPRADEAAEEDQDGPEVSAAVQSEDVDDEPVDKTGSDAGVVGDPLVYDVAIATYRKIAIEAYEEISPDASQNQDDLGADGNTAANVHDAARAPISARKPPNPQPSSAAKAKPKPRFDLQESLKRPIGWEMKRGPLPPLATTPVGDARVGGTMWSPARTAERKKEFKSSEFGGTKRRIDSYLSGGHSKATQRIQELRQRPASKSPPRP